MSAKHPRPWRVGTKVARNVYDANGDGVLMAPDGETALEIVEAVNVVAARSRRPPPRRPKPAPRPIPPPAVELATGREASFLGFLALLIVVFGVGAAWIIAR